MIAPAWPMVRPGGAWKPAMYATTGVRICSPMNAAAFSSSSPPISPTMTTRSVAGSASNRSRTSMNDSPTTGSPPIPTIVELPRPRSASSLPIWYVSVPDRDTSPIRPRAHVLVDAAHVVGGNALGDGDNGLDAGVGRLEDRVVREPGRHEHHGRV